MLSHAAAQSKPDALAPRRADVCVARQVRFQIHPAPARSRPNVDIQHVIAALGMGFPHSLPVGGNVKRAAKILAASRNEFSL